MTNTLEKPQINNNKLNIQFSEEDLELPDLDLYLKTYTEYIEKNNVEDFEELKNEITRELNLIRGRELCQICDSTGFEKIYNHGKLLTVKCLNCRGRGYID